MADYEMPLALDPKRRRLDKKHRAPSAWDRLLPAGFRAVCLKEAAPSCLSRELECRVYKASFGQLGVKPLRLARWRPEEHDTRPRVMHLVCSRETGVSYYAEKTLDKSASAAAFLAHMQTLEKLYARLPLLLTPSESVGFAGHARVKDDEANTVVGRLEADGQAELGLGLACELGLLADTTNHVYVAVQFRGVLEVAVSSEICLCKGMLVVNPNFGHKEFVPRESCIKVRLPAGTQVDLGLDITKETAKGSRAPKLNAQFAVVLRFRVRLADSPDKVAEAEDNWKRLLENARDATAHGIAQEAWRLPPPDPSQTSMEELDSELPCSLVDDQWMDLRAPQDSTRTKYSERVFTPIYIYV